MQIHSDLPKRNMLISSLAFRRDGLKAQSFTAFILNFSLIISSSRRDAFHPDPRFANNHGKDKTTVISRAVLNFPGSSKPKKPPAPFQYILPFPKNFFFYKGTGSLCWELRVHSSISTQNNFMDFVVPPKHWSVGKMIGSGCKAFGQSKPPFHEDRIYIHSFNPFRLAFVSHCYYLAKNQACLFWVATTNKKFGNISLPWDLSFMGGKGCHLYVPPQVALISMTDSNGEYNKNWRPIGYLPFFPGYVGLKLYTQMYSFAPGTPGLPLAFSNGYEMTIPSYPSVCEIVSVGSDHAVFGTVRPLTGMVTRLSY